MQLLQPGFFHWQAWVGLAILAPMLAINYGYSRFLMWVFSIDDPLPLKDLRAAGLSWQKISYLRDLCEKIGSGVINLDALDALPDEDVIDALVKVKGIGRWSAEMFLIFRLHRPDVLPVDDLGIVVAVQRAYGMRKRPRPDRLRALGEAWRPYRSVASWYLWRSLDNEPISNAAVSSKRKRR